MNNLDQILSLGNQNSTFLKSESTDSIQEKNESKHFEGVMEEHWDKSNIEKQTVSKPKSEDNKTDKVEAKKEDSKETDSKETDDNDHSLSSNKTLKAKDNTQVEDVKEKGADPKVDKTEEVDSKKTANLSNKEVSSLKAEESYLALFVQELNQANSKNVPNDQKTVAALPSEDGTDTGNLGKVESASLANNGIIKVDGNVQAQLETLKQIIPDLTLQNQLKEPLQKNGETLKQVFEDKQKSISDALQASLEEEALKKLKLSLAQSDGKNPIPLKKEQAQTPEILEPTKEISSLLLKGIKNPQKEKQSTTEVKNTEKTDLTLKQVGKEKISLKEIGSAQEKNSLSLEQDVSVDLDKPAPDLQLDFDKISLSSAPQISLSKETLMANSALPNGSFAKNPIANFKPEDVSAIHKQLVDSFQVSVKGKENHAELQLTPPDWGRINIQMNVENKNELKIHMVAENANVRQLLEQSTYELKQAMSSSGLGFANINVGVGSESASNWKEKQEMSEQERSVQILKKQVVAPTPYRWVNSQSSGVDQIV